MRAALGAVVFAAVVLGTASGALAGVVLKPGEAPEWQIAEWINGDPGTLGTHKGRVVVIHFFQLWCPGCNSFSIPLMEKWEHEWRDRSDIMLVGIHTVFEGHDVQTPEALRAFVRQKHIRYPVGIDSYRKPDDLVPQTMRRYKNLGTPQLVIIDKQGNLVFSHFGTFDPEPVLAFIERLLKEETRFVPPAKPTDTDRTLSGTWSVRLEQTARSCGPPLAAQDLTVALEVFKDRVEATFPEQKFLGFDSMSLDYRLPKLEFEARLEDDVTVEGAALHATADVHGRFVYGSLPAELDYEFSFTARGGEAGRDCDVQGKGHGVRTGD